MSSCTIFCFSQHHFNTEKCDFIGFASGIYMGKLHPIIIDFTKLHKKDLQNKKIFTLLTSGSNSKKYSEVFYLLLH